MFEKLEVFQALRSLRKRLMDSAAFPLLGRRRRASARRAGRGDAAGGEARPRVLSPFIDAAQVDRWVTESVEKVENRLLPPDVAVKSLADEINRTIRRNLERRIDLQRKFRRITGRPWTPDWQWQRLKRAR